MADAPESQHDSLLFLLEQAKRFKQYNDNNVNKVTKILLNLESTHPWAVMRCSELVSWIHSGVYQALLEEHGTRDQDLSSAKTEEAT